MLSIKREIEKKIFTGDIVKCGVSLDDESYIIIEKQRIQGASLNENNLGTLLGEW